VGIEALRMIEWLKKERTKKKSNTGNRVQGGRGGFCVAWIFCGEEAGGGEIYILVEYTY
jgi:hypothetical protein